MVDEDVADAARALAAQGNPAVAVFHVAFPHHDVLARLAHPASVAVASGLDGDAVVSGIEHASLDEHVGASFRIATVVVGSVGGDLHVANGDVAAEHRVQFPHGGVAYA